MPRIHDYLLAAFLFAFASFQASADTVRLSTKIATSSIEATGTIEATGFFEATGTIVDYTGERITLERAGGGGAPRSYPAERVLHVQTDWPEGYEAGRAALAAHDYRRAIEQFTVAARNDQRPWVRRLAMTELMHAYAAAGNWATAGDLLVALAKSDPTTPAMDIAPLAWFPVDGVPRGKIENWLADDTSPVARLLGASHALSTSLRGKALEQLRALQRSNDSRIAFLARAQSWRAEVVTAKPDDVDRWEKLIAKSPETSRAGAWFVVGEARRQQRQHDAAALAYLRVPVLFPGQRQLAARALWEAARMAQSAGRQDEANGITEELIDDYAETPPAKQARAMLQSRGLQSGG